MCAKIRKIGKSLLLFGENIPLWMITLFIFVSDLKEIVNFKLKES